MTLRLTQSAVLFPVPLLTFAFDEADALNTALEVEIAERRQSEPAVAPRSNRGGWHSANDFFARTEPAHRKLAAGIVDALKLACEQSIPDHDWALVEMACEGWVNVAAGDDYHTPHDHPGAFWSGVYYVSVPRDGGSGGEIEFLSGRAGNSHSGLISAPMSWDYLRIRPQAGFALVFPGHVRHWVTPFRSAAERISVAFNAAFRRRR